jgi:hypothetical protein
VSALDPQPNLPELLGYGLVAPRMKVLYVPTTKVACSTLKLLVSQIEGSYDESAANVIISPNISQEQTVHNYRVHGLERFFELKSKRQWEILQSPEWLRVGTLRDPLSRLYSSWENRVLLRAPGTPEVIFERCPDVLVDGRVDVAATFQRFVREFHADPHAFMVDDHFRPQYNTLYSNQLEYHHLVRVDVPGQLQALADALNTRAATNVPLQRLNSGLGIKPPQVYDKATADLATEIYARDYEWYGFTPHSFSATTPQLVLDPLQQALLGNLRDTTERLIFLSRAAFARVGFRYGVTQIFKSTKYRLRYGRRTDEQKLLQW